MQLDVSRFAADRIVGRGLQDSDAFPHGLWREMGAAGLFGIGLPEAVGGVGGGYAAIASAERALVEHGGCLGIALSWAAHQMAARYFLLGFGSARQQAAFLPALAAGRITASVAISEPGAGAHPKHLSTAARAEGDEWVIDGEKAYVTNGPLADLFVVLAITAMDAGRKRYSAFLVPRDAAGLEVVEGPSLGFLRPSPHCRLRLTACRVPHAALLGEAGTAYERMALPFRDVEDAVGTAALSGALRRLLPGLTGDDPAARGAVVALVAVLETASEAAVRALDAGGDERAPAVLAGTRVLAAGIIERVRACGGGASREGATLLADLDALLGVARGPRQARLARLGAAQSIAASAAR